MEKQIIWNNQAIDFCQWKEDYIMYRKENMYENPEDVSDHDVWAFIRESLENQMWDEQAHTDYMK